MNFSLGMCLLWLDIFIKLKVQIYETYDLIQDNLLILGLNWVLIPLSLIHLDDKEMEKKSW